MEESSTVSLDPVAQNVVNRVAPGSRVIGEVDLAGGILVQGTIEGAPLTVRDGPLIVLEDGAVRGSVTVFGDAYIMGTAGGPDLAEGGINLTVHGTLHIAATGKTFGAIACVQLKTYAGCMVSSRISTVSEGQAGVAVGHG